MKKRFGALKNQILKYKIIWYRITKKISILYHSTFKSQVYPGMLFKYTYKMLHIYCQQHN